MEKKLKKYWPPDFDPSLIPKHTTSKCKVRFTLPMTIQCLTCDLITIKYSIMIAYKDENRYRFCCPKCKTETTLFVLDNEISVEHNCMEVEADGKPNSANFQILE